MKTAFEKLVRKLSPALKGIIFKTGRHHQFFDSDDLYQEALIHLWCKYTSGGLEDKTDSYILQGCYFHLKNYIRKNNKKVKLVSFEHRDYFQDEDESPIEEPMGLRSGESVFDNVYCKMLIEQINNNGLTVREKEVFNLALEGLTAREIGARLGISHVRVVKLRKTIAGKCLRHMDMH